VVSSRGKRYNPGMDLDIQREDEILLSTSLEEDDYTDLKTYPEDQSVVEKVSDRDPGMAFDQALDSYVPRYYELVVKVAPDAMQLGEQAILLAVLVKRWVDERHEKKKSKIEANETAPLLFDHNGRRIEIFRKTKKRNKR
jgi:hypothetical protein